MATDGKGRRERQTVKAGRVNGHRRERQTGKADGFFAGDLPAEKVALLEGDEGILSAFTVCG
jgi:hypothetical protein